MKKFLLICSALAIVSCGGGEEEETPTLSDDSTLSLAIVKGKYIELKEPATSLDEVPNDPTLFATRQLTVAEAADTTGEGNYVTIFIPTHSGATIKAVQYDPGADISNFAQDTAYAEEAITVQDFFIIRVTAEDGETVSYYKIGLTIS